VPVVGDRLDEPDETLRVVLDSSSGAPIADGEAVGAIVDDDPPSLTIGDVTTIERNSGTRRMNFTVRLSKRWDRPVTADWAVQDLTTAAGSDYQNAPGQVAGQVVIPPGSRTATVTVTVIGDRAIEGVAETTGGPRFERMSVALSNPAQAVIADAEGIGRIQDDD
jgi:large repetitive protein